MVLQKENHSHRLQIFVKCPASVIFFCASICSVSQGITSSSCNPHNCRTSPSSARTVACEQHSSPRRFGQRTQSTSLRQTNWTGCWGLLRKLSDTCLILRENSSLYPLPAKRGIHSKWCGCNTIMVVRLPFPQNILQTGGQIFLAKLHTVLWLSYKTIFCFTSAFFAFTKSSWRFLCKDATRSKCVHNYFLYYNHNNGNEQGRDRLLGRPLFSFSFLLFFSRSLPQKGGFFLSFFI